MKMIQLPQTLFALRHKSGAYMPDKTGRAGGTYVDPFKAREGQTKYPRLFITRNSARMTLEWWARGPVEMGNINGYYDLPEIDIIGQTKAPGRDISEWSIVLVQINEVSQ